jgi:hypothetical protein
MAQRAGISVPSTFPPQLAWERMRSIEFNFTKPLPAATAEQNMVLPVWQDALNDAKAKQNFAYVMYAKRGQALFTVFDTMGACTTPANGRDAYDAYSVCPGRVVVGNPSNTTGTTTFNFPQMCYYEQTNNPDAPLDKNHMQFAYDEGIKMAYFRVIQYGKFVAACNRAIQF